MIKVQDIDEHGYDQNGVNLEEIDNREKDTFTPITQETIQEKKRILNDMEKNGKFPQMKLMEVCLKKCVLEDKSMDEIILEFSEEYHRPSNKFRSYIRNYLAAINEKNADLKNTLLKKVYVEENKSLSEEEEEIDKETEQKDKLIQMIQMCTEKMEGYKKNMNEGEDKTI